MNIKAIIIDDEKPAITELEFLLKKHEDIQIITSCSNADEAITAINNLKPDLIFLDINMPGKNGFELLEALEEAPYVIFITAFDHFAIKAFEANAFDYLLKPVAPDRLRKTILDLTVEMERERSIRVQQNKMTANSKIFIKDGEKCFFIRIENIYLIESIGNYVKLYFKDLSAMAHRTLNQLEETLPPDIFFRANRSQMINLDYVSKVSPYFKGGMLVELEGKQKIEISQRQAVKFRERLSI